MNGSFQFDRFSFDASDGRLEDTASGAGQTLRPQVGRLLAAFLARPGEVIDRDTLCREVWGEDAVVDFEAGLAALLRELRKALTEVGADPAWVETIPRRGYRFHAVAPDAAAAPKARPRWIVPAVVAGVVAFFTAWWLGGTDAPPAHDPNEMTLAILPFERYGDAERAPEHAEFLLADAMLARFWKHRIEGLVLIGRASLRPYAERDDIAVAVAEDLGVNLLVEGVIVAEEAGWTVTARLLHMPAGRVLWSHSVAWPEAETLPVSDTADRFIRDIQDNFREIYEAFHGLAPSGTAQ